MIQADSTAEEPGGHRMLGLNAVCQLRRGERRESLGNYGDKISSIRVFGGARVTVYDDRNFSGARGSESGDIPDLREWRVRHKGNHTWNDRISSVRVQ